MHSREGWSRGAEGAMTIKGRTYKHLVEFKRPCAACGQPFSIYVTLKIALGHADSNSFALRNCEQHRRNKGPAEQAELDRLRTYEATATPELQAVYARNSELFAEVQQLKARLATYELHGAMQAQAAIGCEPVQNTTNGVLPTRYPWE